MLAKFTASQLITQRQQVSLLVRKGLIERALDFNIILDDVALTELAFSPQYSAAVESKQVAAQEAQRATFLVGEFITQLRPFRTYSSTQFQRRQSNNARRR